MAKQKLKAHHIDRAWCKGCSICVHFCPTQVLALDKHNIAYPANPDACICCRMCEYRCPDLAIEVECQEQSP